MGMMIVFTLIGLIIGILSCKDYATDEKAITIVMLMMLGCMVGSIGSAFIPIPVGYSGNPQFVEAFEVRPISFGEYEDEIVFKDENDDFICMREKFILNEDKDGMIKSLVTYNLGKNEVTITKSDNVETPTMFKYTEKHKLHFWSFWAEKQEREIYKLMLPQN